MACLEYTGTPMVRDSQEVSEVHADRMRMHKRNAYSLVLECRSCGMRWSNTPDDDGELPKGFWVYPRGCNW